MLDSLRQQVYEANMSLHRMGLAPFTWGNASGIDRDKGLVVIKPSGVPYDALTPEKLVVVSLDGSVVEGDLRPSSDTPTHLELYKAFPEIGGCVHTHSENAVAFAQAGLDLPAFGTTHADFAFGSVPCTRDLNRREVQHDYEKNTGLVIAQTFRERQLDPMAVPAVLVRSHGPFTWGATPEKAAENAGVLEICCRMAYMTMALGREDPLPRYLLEKHYLRKHGKDAYYGQKGEGK